MVHGGDTCRSACSRDIPRVRPPTPRVIDETEEYTSTVAGVTVEAVRVGRGLGPNIVLGVPGEQLTFTMSKVGFPMHACARIPEDRIVAAFIHENPASSRWCGIELKPGSALVYLPGTEHVAVNRPVRRCCARLPGCSPARTVRTLEGVRRASTAGCSSTRVSNSPRRPTESRRSPRCATSPTCPNGGCGKPSLRSSTRRRPSTSGAGRSIGHIGVSGRRCRVTAAR